MASYPSYLTVFKTVKGTPKSAPPLTFLTNAEIPDALIQKGLRPARRSLMMVASSRYQMP